MRERVFEVLRPAALDGRPCPTNVQLGAAVDATIGEVTRAIAGLSQDKRIAMETRGPKRRVGVNGIWSAWTGEAMPSRPACPPPAEHAAPPTNGGAVASAIDFLRQHGCQITRAAGAYWLNGEEITAARILEKAGRKRAILAAGREA